MERYFGESTPKLGFGLMRLPRLADGKTIDIEHTKKMVDLFMDAGFTYFDTAYVYEGSEEAARAALVDRYPRESFTLATKLNASLPDLTEEDAKQQLFTSLERTGAGYFDYYLLHAVQRGNCKKYEEYRLWDFVREQKTKGLIRHYGFSFHADPELLDQLLTEHPDVEFVQLQLNYADWDHPRVMARENYEVVRKHGKSVVVMEPVKGGFLAEPPRNVREVLRGASADASFASWAIRYTASLDGILTVLSGMSDLEQMRDNLSYMKDFQPLDEAEREVIQKARQVLIESESIPCTACRYCTANCPKQIPIPGIFGARNLQLIWEQQERGRQRYAEVVKSAGRASDCIACGQCERACPQHLGVIQYLKDCAAPLE